MADLPQGVESEHVEFPAGRVGFLRAGTSGPPVVLLPGAGPDNALLAWRHVLPALAAEHRVFAPDLPGQGGSLPWAGSTGQRTLEEALRWLLETWQLPEVTLVGSSTGGSVATGFALRNPNRVNRLALVGPTGLQHRLRHHALVHAAVRSGLTGKPAATALRAGKPLVRLMLNRLVFTGGGTVPDFADITGEVAAEIRNRRSVTSGWHAEAIAARHMRVNHLPLLGRLESPVLFIHGEQDVLVPPAVAADAATAAAGQLRTIPGAGHWPSREKPAELITALQEFTNTSE
ncbi:alpha/beta hydrolase [Saccharopolyspora sp. HNM0983]|uniref:Alpha/beta hydrolase n=1 Tax=Saccharopolyspora montiporae TaxID=2781240 RepID=A0A929G1E4_9PSEU|nr:alpha/beta hydrolase [Saccharopolyspora sp. HNM0983]MBE9375757.1 alpha/beta hydrolase [Saccharopolyspora sp. HNM0983]